MMMVSVMARVNKVLGWAEFCRPKRVPFAIQLVGMPYVGFDLLAEGLGHGLDDEELLPLFDPSKATFGGFGRKMNSNVSAVSPSHE